MAKIKKGDIVKTTEYAHLQVFTQAHLQPDNTWEVLPTEYTDADCYEKTTRTFREGEYGVVVQHEIYHSKSRLQNNSYYIALFDNKFF